MFRVATVSMKLMLIEEGAEAKIDQFVIDTCLVLQPWLDAVISGMNKKEGDLESARTQLNDASNLLPPKYRDAVATWAVGSHELTQAEDLIRDQR